MSFPCFDMTGISHEKIVKTVSNVHLLKKCASRLSRYSTKLVDPQMPMSVHFSTCFAWCRCVWKCWISPPNGYLEVSNPWGTVALNFRLIGRIFHEINHLVIRVSPLMETSMVQGPAPVASWNASRTSTCNLPMARCQDIPIHSENHLRLYLVRFNYWLMPTTTTTTRTRRASSKHNACKHQKSQPKRTQHKKHMKT